MKTDPADHSLDAARRSGFTLTEVLIATFIGALTIGGIIYGFVQSAQRAEWSAYNLAAQGLAVQRIEQARAAKWDPLAYPQVDELIPANFPPRVNILDVPLVAGRAVYATNTVFIATVSTNPPIKRIRVEVTWGFGTGTRASRIFTNRVVTLRAADQ